MAFRFGPSNTTVQIGTQVWTSRNLDVTTYRNGDAIPQVTDQTTWDALTTGAWCWYNNDSANNRFYGKLYNWYAFTDARNLAPVGYHIPTLAEWTILTTYLSNAGGAMKSTSTLWSNPNTGATNSSGFNALPGGNRNYGTPPDPNDLYLGERAYFWQANASDLANGYYLYLDYTSTTISTSNGSRTYGFSVRLIKD